MRKTHDESGEMELDLDDAEPFIDDGGEGGRLAELLRFERRPESVRRDEGDAAGSGVFRLSDIAARMSIGSAARSPAAVRPPAERVPPARAELFPLETTTTDMPPPCRGRSQKRLLVSLSAAAALVLALCVFAVLVVPKRQERAADEAEKARIASRMAEIERLTSALEAARRPATAVPAAVVPAVVVPAPAQPSAEDAGADGTAKKIEKKIAKRERRRHVRHGSRREARAEESGAGSPGWSGISAAMDRVERRAPSCARYGEGTVQLRITVSGDGRVRSSESVGAFAGTGAGRCVEALARKARFPRFDGDPFTFVHSVPVR